MPAAHTELEEPFSLAGFKFVPPKITDGARCGHPRLDLDLVHSDSCAGAVSLFVGTIGSELLAVKISPAGGADPWVGFARLGPTTCKPPKDGSQFPSLHLRLRVEDQHSEPMLDLIRLRMEMVEDDVVKASVRMLLHQPPLPLGRSEGPQSGAAG
jgi:hypothetical protein